MIIKFNKHINESLLDKMVGKSKDDIDLSKFDDYNVDSLLDVGFTQKEILQNKKRFREAEVVHFSKDLIDKYDLLNKVELRGETLLNDGFGITKEDILKNDNIINRLIPKTLDLIKFMEKFDFDRKYIQDNIDRLLPKFDENSEYLYNNHLNKKDTELNSVYSDLSFGSRYSNYGDKDAYNLEKTLFILDWYNITPGKVTLDDISDAFDNVSSWDVDKIFNSLNKKEYFKNKSTREIYNFFDKLIRSNYGFEQISLLYNLYNLGVKNVDDLLISFFLEKDESGNYIRNKSNTSVLLDNIFKGSSKRNNRKAIEEILSSKHKNEYEKIVYYDNINEFYKHTLATVEYTWGGDRDKPTIQQWVQNYGLPNVELNWKEVKGRYKYEALLSYIILMTYTNNVDKLYKIKGINWNEDGNQHRSWADNTILGDLSSVITNSHITNGRATYNIENDLTDVQRKLLYDWVMEDIVPNLDEEHQQDLQLLYLIWDRKKLENLIDRIRKYYGRKKKSSMNALRPLIEYLSQNRYNDTMYNKDRERLADLKYYLEYYLKNYKTLTQSQISTLEYILNDEDVIETVKDVFNRFLKENKVVNFKQFESIRDEMKPKTKEEIEKIVGDLPKDYKQVDPKYANNSSARGGVDTSYDTLVKLFGEPNKPVWSYKTVFEWNLINNEGRFFRIYDWKVLDYIYDDISADGDDMTNKEVTQIVRDYIKEQESFHWVIGSHDYDGVKYLKNYIIYNSLNESLRDKMEGKSEEDVLKTIERLEPKEKLLQLKRYDMVHLIDDDEILDAIKDDDILNKYNFLISINKEELINIKDVKKEINKYGFNILGLKLTEKGNFGQILTAIYISKDDKYYYIGELRELGGATYYSYPNEIKYGTPNITLTKKLTELPLKYKSEILGTLKAEKEFGGLMDEPISHMDMLLKKLDEKFITSFNKYLNEKIQVDYFEKNPDFYLSKNVEDIKKEKENRKEEEEEVNIKETKQELKKINYKDIIFDYNDQWKEYSIANPPSLVGKYSFRTGHPNEYTLGTDMRIETPYHYKLYLALINNIGNKSDEIIFSPFGKELITPLFKELGDYFAVCHSSSYHTTLYLTTNYQKYKRKIKELKEKNLKIIYTNYKTKGKDFMDIDAVTRTKVRNKLKNISYDDIYFTTTNNGKTYGVNFKNEALEKINKLTPFLSKDFFQSEGNMYPGKMYFGHLRNRYHIGGLPLELQGIGFGYKIYKAFLKHNGYFVSDEQTSTGARKMYYNLLKDDDVLHVIDRSGKFTGQKLGSDSEKVLLIWKDYPKIEKLINIIRKTELENNRTYKYDKDLMKYVRNVQK